MALRLNLKQLEEVIDLQLQLLKVYPTFRRGQALYNALNELHPTIANKVKGSVIDPYHIDSNISDCISHIVGLTTISYGNRFKKLKRLINKAIDYEKI